MKPILISSAALSGLLLARSLSTSNIPFQLFERDASIAARAQGYRLRISTDGLNALKEVLSQVEFSRLRSGTAQTGACGIHSVEAVSGTQKDGTLMPNGDDKGVKLGGDVLGISRGFLRQCLFEGEEDVVVWGKQATGYSETSTAVMLSFADGSKSQQGSMLIAADRPNSAIAKQLTDGKVHAFDTGARMIHDSSTVGLITNVRPGSLDEDTKLGWVVVGSPGSLTAPGDNFSIVGKVAADLSRDLTKRWHAKVRPIFEHQNDNEAAYLKMSTADPKGVPEWQNNPRVTIMGDAVHCMTPAGGVGPNTALRDAAFIGRLLNAAGGWRNGITAEYERKMRTYASEPVKMSFETAAKQFKITDLK